MEFVVAVFGLALLAFVLADAFQTLVVPRSANSNLRLTALFFTHGWALWRWAGRRIAAGNKREAHLWTFGPLSLITLMALWATLLVFAFGMLQWGVHSPIRGPEARPGFWSDVYLSGTTLFTLGYGDVTPLNPIGRCISVTEAGVGFGFLAIVIGYLPVLYAGFSKREVAISMLDARAGSPPTAFELLRRHASEKLGPCALGELLAEWERWAADLLESHLSYPTLVFYRSQHDRQSWLASMTCLLDTCALVIAGVGGPANRQARLTFAMCRHALIDLTLILNTKPSFSETRRLSQEQAAALVARLTEVTVPFEHPVDFDELNRLAGMYEPYIATLAEFLVVDIPPWCPDNNVLLDNWEASAWEAHNAADSDWVLHPRQ
ncbi:MAG TPA: potassium channel family protein [Capsulimonadaceae bacterium]